MFKGKCSGFTLSLKSQLWSKTIQNVSSSSNRVVSVIIILKELVLCKINNRHLESPLIKSMKYIFSCVKILSIKLPYFDWIVRLLKIHNKHTKQLTFSFENLSMKQQRPELKRGELHSPSNTFWRKPFRNTSKLLLAIKITSKSPYVTTLRYLLS